MNWFKAAKVKDEQRIVRQIKDRLKSHPMFARLMGDYGIPLSDIDDNLEISFMNLEGKFAEGNGKEIHLDESLCDNGEFPEDRFHYVVHEFWHWVRRRAEHRFYFNDEEEVQSFVLGMAWEMMRHVPDDKIVSIFYPIIRGHFEQEEDAQRMFEKMMADARRFAGEAASAQDH